MSGFLGLWGNEDADAAMNLLEQNRDLYSGIDVPELKWDQYNPENFTPEMINNVETVKENPELLSSQMDALKSLSGLARDGLSDVDEAAYARARSEAGQLQRSGTEAALTSAQSRGLSGSGSELAMREMATQNASNSAQNADLQQAADAAKMRALYASTYGQQLAGARSQDAQVGTTNANILNNFNNANTNARNAATYANTQAANEAQKYNQQGRIQTQQQNFDNELKKAAGQSGANNGAAQGYAARDAASTNNWNQVIGAGTRLGAAYMGS